jgi:sterol desaturase/sphingolipid hydroxylase (fatty acid hydroxylase superfamily)
MELGLVGFFVLLALAEVILPNSSRRTSAPNDARLVTNFSLAAMVLVAGGLLPLARITAAIGATRLGFGLTRIIELPWAAILLATLLLDSFAAYWVHRLMHATPLLWRLHRVHHADCAVDVSTSLRNHPLELLVTVPPSVFVVLVLGSPPSVILVTQTILMAAALWEHADLALPGKIDRMLSVAVITPRLHRVHHSVDRVEHDSNFGDWLTIWDRLFGTLRCTDLIRTVGLEHQRARNDHLLDQMASPLFPA